MAVWSSSIGSVQRPTTMSIPSAVGIYSSQASAGSWRSPESIDPAVPQLGQQQAHLLSYEQRVCNKHWHCLQVERQNLLQACRVAVKALVDRVCFAVIDDECAELAQFLSVAENILFHGYNGQENTSILSSDEPILDFWPVLNTGLSGSEAVCTVENMSDVHTDLGKCRAWLRTCLVQKSLATSYLKLLNNTQLVGSCFSTSALLRREEGHLVFGFLQALDSVDFCLCLKDNIDLDVGVRSVVDYSYLIQFKSSAVGTLADEGEWWDALEADALPNVPRDPQSAKANSIVVAAMTAAAAGGGGGALPVVVGVERPATLTRTPATTAAATAPRTGDEDGGDGDATAVDLSATLDAKAVQSGERPAIGESLAGEDQADGAESSSVDGTLSSTRSAPCADGSRDAAADDTSGSGTGTTSSSTGGQAASTMSSDSGVGMADFIRLQHHVSREREQRNYCEELVKQRDRQLSDATQDKEALLSRIDAVQQQADKEQQQLEAIILELHEKVADLTLENRRLTQELTAATTPSEGLFSGFFSR